MKTLIIFLSTIAVGFTSCQTGNFNNFNRKKFTNLKPLKSQSVSKNSIKEECHHKNVFKEFDEAEKINDKDPKVIALKNAINKGTKIIVKKDDEYFVVKNPFYDQTANTLFGKMNKLDTISELNYLQLETLVFHKKKNGQSEISMTDVLSVDYISDNQQESNIETKGEEIDTNWKETYKQEIASIPIKSLKEDPEHEVHESEYKVRARKTFFQCVALWYPLSGVFIALYLVAFPFAIIGGVMLIVAFIMAARSAYNSRMYFDECKKNGVKPTKRSRRVWGWSWFVMLLMSILAYLLPALLVLLIINGSAKKKFRNELTESSN